MPPSVWTTWIFLLLRRLQWSKLDLLLKEAQRSCATLSIRRHWWHQWCKCSDEKGVRRSSLECNISQMGMGRGMQRVWSCFATEKWKWKSNESKRQVFQRTSRVGPKIKQMFVNGWLYYFIRYPPFHQVGSWSVTYKNNHLCIAPSWRDHRYSQR